MAKVSAVECPGRKLVNYWRELGLPIPAGCPGAALEAFEKHAGVVLPDDLRNYFRLVNGMKDAWPGDQDPKGFSFWPLSKVRWVPEELAEMSPQTSAFPGAEDFYVFADYMGWSWAYAIRLSQSLEKNLVILIGKEVPELVAESFSAFVDLYVIDSPALYESPPLTGPFSEIG